MNNQKNMDIILIVQNHYRRESTISTFALIEEVHKTFVALSKAGMYAQGCRFEVQFYGKIVAFDGPPSFKGSVRLVTMKI